MRRGFYGSPMDSVKRNNGPTPFRDLTNTDNGGGQNASISQPEVVDAKERKRERERARYAAMSIEQKNERNKKRRESRQRKKGQPMLPDNSKVGVVAEAKSSLQSQVERDRVFDKMADDFSDSYAKAYASIHKW